MIKASTWAKLDLNLRKPLKNLEIIFTAFSFNFLFRRSCDDEKRNVVEMQKNTRQGRKTTNNLQTWSSLVQALFEWTLNRILSVGGVDLITLRLNKSDQLYSIDRTEIARQQNVSKREREKMSRFAGE